MTDNDVIGLKKWFDDYTRVFYSPDREEQKNIANKVEHTAQVCRTIVEIASGSSLNENEIRLAETIALFHDLGRFPQYARYKTFRDALSVNHGLMGARTLIKEKVLQGLPENEQEIIIQAVKFHNAFAIPTTLNGDNVFFLKLIRDADKVDIFRVFIKYYESPVEERASATAFGVPDIPEYSQPMLSCILSGKVASYSNIRTENDFKLMKLSWVYDMHFDESVRILRDRGYINKIIDMLPGTDEIRSAVDCLTCYMSKRLGNG